MKSRDSAEAPYKLGIVHEWLVTSRGAERLLCTFDGFLPPFEILTLFLKPSALAPGLGLGRCQVSILGRLPFLEHYYRYLLPLFPLALRSLQTEGFEGLISIHHSVAKAIPNPSRVPHVCYCLTPMRYLWEPSVYGAVLNGSWRGRLLRLLEKRLKNWDLETNSGVDHFVAVSRTVQKRIRKKYDRDSSVIYPGVDVDFFRSHGETRGDFFLIVSALVPQKRIELAVSAFNCLKKPLLVVGEGPLRNRLEGLANSNVRFLGRLSDERVRELFSRARALIFPGLEDFGLVPVEAQSCGCPVIAFGEGGASETVIEEETGLFFHEADLESLIEAVTQFELRTFDPERARKNVVRFSNARFVSEWKRYLREIGFPVRI